MSEQKIYCACGGCKSYATLRRRVDGYFLLNVYDYEDGKQVMVELQLSSGVGRAMMGVLSGGASGDKELARAREESEGWLYACQSLVARLAFAQCAADGWEQLHGDTQRLVAMQRDKIAGQAVVIEDLRTQLEAAQAKENDNEEN